MSKEDFNHIQSADYSGHALLILHSDIQYTGVFRVCNNAVLSFGDSVTKHVLKPLLTRKSDIMSFD